MPIRVLVFGECLSTISAEKGCGFYAMIWEGAGTTSIKAYDKLMRGWDYYYRYNRQDRLKPENL